MWLSLGMLHRKVWQALTDDITLRTEAVRFSEKSINIYRAT
jgi:hypothetical protein